jgi:hypothetical protein
VRGVLQNPGMESHLKRTGIADSLWIHNLAEETFNKKDSDHSLRILFFIYPYNL